MVQKSKHAKKLSHTPNAIFPYFLFCLLSSSRMDIREHKGETVTKSGGASHMIAVQKNAISAWEKEFRQIRNQPFLSDPSIMPSMEYMRSNLFKPPQNTMPKRKRRCPASEPDLKRAREETNNPPATSPAPPPATSPAPPPVASFSYTSGSTGKPRAVMISHGNMIAALNGLQKSYFINPTI